MKKTVYLYLFDTFAEFEIGHLLSVFNMEKQIRGDNSKYSLKTVASGKDNVKGLGGLVVSPDCTIDQIDIENTAGLILPGGNEWNDPRQVKILDIAESLIEKGILVAGICGATLALADRGVLNDRPHASNSLDFLKMSASYSGEKSYVDFPCVSEFNLVTASAAGSLEFTRDIMTALDMFPNDFTENWYSYFKTGQLEFYNAMLKSKL